MMTDIIKHYQDLIDGRTPDREIVKASAIAAAYALDDAIVNNRTAYTERCAYDASVWLLSKI